MAATSDENVLDGDTTAAGVAPATASADEEDRTVQQAPDPKIRHAIAKELKGQPSPAPPSSPSARLSPRAPVPIPTASKATGASAPVRSKRMTVVGIAPPAAGSAAAPPSVARTPSSISPLASTMDRKVGPTTTNPTSGPSKLGAPGPLSAKAAAAPGSIAKRDKDKPASEADEEDASITATAPAPRTGGASTATASTAAKPPPLPLTVPGPVQIREMPPPNVADDEEESQDETEVRTLVTAPEEPAGAAPAPAPPDADDDDDIEDSVTTQAPSAVKGARLPEDEPKTSPPLMAPARMPPPIPAAGRSAFDQPPIPSQAVGAVEPLADTEDDAYNVEDSVTTRGPAVADVAGVSTMSQALGLPPKKMGLPPAIEDGTEGTTNRVAGRNKKAAAPRPGSPAALDVLPKVGAASLDEDEDESPEENRTKVMVGAPAPTTGPSAAARAARSPLTGGLGSHASAGAARAHAPAEKPRAASESGLRVAPEHPPPQEERASLGAMMAGALHANHDRGSGVAPREYPSQPLPALQPHQVPHHYPASEPNLALGATIPASSALLQQQMRNAVPQLQQYDFAATIKKPRYGLLVGLVALLSFAIPLVLFLWLHQNVQEPYARAPAEVASDKQGFAPPPGKSLAPPPPASVKKPGGRR